jgi:hypothetical protein
MDEWNMASMVNADLAGGGRQFEAGGVRPIFKMKVVEDKAKSLATGEPHFKDVEYVELRIPGDRNNIPEVPVTDAHRRIYRDAYKHWKETKQNPLSGRPLEELPGIVGSQIETLRYHGVHSIEDLAGLSDELAGRLPTGTRALMKRAQDWLDGAKGNAASEKLRTELARKKAG